MEQLRGNVLSSAEYTKKITEVLNFSANILSKSLGPYGSNTLIQQKVNSFMTKDGATIFKYLKFEDEEANAILSLLRNNVRALVKIVGDGSTSSIVVANYFYKFLSDNINFSYSPKQIVSFLNIICNHIEKYARENAIKIDLDNDIEKVIDIASISTNNDREIGTIIGKAYQEVGKYGFLKFQESKDEFTSYEIKSGFEINGTYCNTLMINNKSLSLSVFENADILLFNETLTESDMDGIVSIIESHIKDDKALVLVAPDWNNLYQQFFTENLMTASRNGMSIKILAVTFPLSTAENIEIFKDLEAYTGAQIFDKKTSNRTFTKNLPTGHYKLGHCDKVVADKKSTNFYIDELDIENNKYIQERIGAIELELEKHEELERKGSIYDDMEVFKLKKRKSSLTKSLAIINVGGKTDFEKKVAIFLVEDAISAVKSALYNGYNIGGTLYIPILIQKYGDQLIKEITIDIKENINSNFSEEEAKIFIDTIMKAFCVGYSTVLSNADFSEKEAKKIVLECILDNKIYNLLTRSFESLETTKIINSVQTDIIIMKTMVSIIGLIFTSNQMITLFPEHLVEYTEEEKKARRHIFDNIDKIIPDEPLEFQEMKRK